MKADVGKRGKKKFGIFEQISRVSFPDNGISRLTNMLGIRLKGLLRKVNGWNQSSAELAWSLTYGGSNFSQIFNYWWSFLDKLVHMLVGGEWVWDFVSGWRGKGVLVFWLNNSAVSRLRWVRSKSRCDCIDW